MVKESLYPANYAKTNVRAILDAIKNGSSATVVSPAGFGKSSILRFLSYNNKYKRNFRFTKKLVFIYVDLSDLSQENVNVLSNNNTVSQITVRTVESLENVLIRSIYHYFDLNSVTRPAEESTKSNEVLMKLINFLHRGKNKIYFLIDGTEHILDEQNYSQRQLLKTVRDHFKGYIEYIFTITDLKVLDKIKNGEIKGISQILYHKLVFLKLNSLEEIDKVTGSAMARLLFKTFTKNTAVYKRKLGIISRLSGNYPVYAKILRNQSKAEFPNISSIEFEIATQKLLSSLSKHQIEIMTKVPSGQSIPKSDDAQLLIQFGLLKLNNSQIQLFSQIFENFLRKFKYSSSLETKP